MNEAPTVTAFADHGSTAVGQRIAKLAADHPGQSGFALIRYGRQALAARIAWADLAERSLDVQYYIWEADPTGRILADRLVRAAERGVRVRVLLDDINLSGRDAGIAALDAHPNIEIRIFNPLSSRTFRVLDFLTDLARVNHRMHNKIMIVDNALALVGGRNVGAHYFQAHSDSNFRDLDVVGAGPIVRETSSVFDRFWNGPWSRPMSQVAGRTYTIDEHEATVANLRRQIEKDEYPFPLETDAKTLLAQRDEILDRLIWAPGTIIWEDPAAIFDRAEPGRMSQALYARLDRLETELLIESAYFVPRDQGVATAKSLTDRGVRIRVLTNSLSANDVLAAHAGYAKYRRRLIEAGVALHELRPYPGPVRQRVVSSESKAALHTKAMVFDRKDVFVGSFNLDPRSASINTEAGLYVESPELAAQVVEYMQEGVAPENAFRVSLDGADELSWTVEMDSETVRFDKDPDSSLTQRWLTAVIGMLPVDSQL